MIDPNFPCDVRQYHETKKLPYEGPPRTLRADELAGALVEITDQLGFYVGAAADDDLTGQLRHLSLLLFHAVSLGVRQSLPLNLAWEETHRAQMAKAHGAPAVIQADLQHLVDNAQEFHRSPDEIPVLEAELVATLPESSDAEVEATEETAPPGGLWKW